MFNKHSDSGYASPMDGIQQKTLVHGAKTLMTEFRLRKGSIVPQHSHQHEQTGYLVTGKVKFNAGSEVIVCRPGDSWCIQSDLEHGAEALEDSVLVEVFSPVREDYLQR